MEASAEREGALLSNILPSEHAERATWLVSNYKSNTDKIILIGWISNNNPIEEGRLEIDSMNASK